MGELLTFFFLYHFHAEPIWWVAFGAVLFMEMHAKSKKQEKIDEFLDNAKAEYDLREEERNKETEIYLGGMLDG